jgi:pyruvate ferredoxin oxidoreductase gamma subunit
MYRIRLHGRGGQGIKTASRILGSAFFAEGFEVQDAPRYGAERRGAPIFASVRASREPIFERGPIRWPDLVVVGDATLLGVAAAGVLVDVAQHTALLLVSDEAPAVWKERLRFAGPVHTLAPAAEEQGDLPFVGATCAAAAARLVGAIGGAALEAAVREELAELGPALVERNLALALAAFERFAPSAGSVGEGPELAIEALPGPDWVELPLDPARVAAPDVFGPPTSVEVRTGLWRTLRPMVDREHCHRCHWICTTFCPDGAIAAAPDGYPAIDYDHCKGCLVCVAVCPAHAIRAVPEREAAREAGEAAP